MSQACSPGGGRLWRVHVGVCWRVGGGVLSHRPAGVAWRIYRGAAEYRRRCEMMRSRAAPRFGVPESPLEDAFLTKVIRRYRIPAPDFQARIEGMRVDFRWTAARLTVEVYGNHHVNPSMLQTDAARDNVLGLGDQTGARHAPRIVHPGDARVVQRSGAELVAAGEEAEVEGEEPGDHDREEGRATARCWPPCSPGTRSGRG